MISPFSPPKINSGDKASIVNDASIWNSQFKTRLLNLSQNLQNAIQENDGRNVEYFLGLIARLQYHPTNHWTTFMPIDMLLLPKTPRCYRKGHKNHRKKSQLASSSTSRRRHRRSSDTSSEEETPSNQGQATTSSTTTS